MFERLKDFFYDVSDIILSIIIIVIMVFAISWKLSDTISYSPIKINPQENSSYAVNPEPDESHSLESENPSTSSEEDETSSEEISIESPESETNEVSQGEAAEEVPSTENESPSEEDVVAKPSNENINVVSVKEINFIVPSGATGSSIAKKLQSEGLIEDTSIFLNRLEALNLGNKLRSGTFKLSTDMDIDGIINKLTGR